ncbi:adenine-specific methyltransferase EcoRI family protein [Mesorhizobium sp. M0220]|uniref:adenine-specific methyltransferase EcoRI family protein n=1 Tax=Mesorhizobium sp. M0220 TaxID=2956920 RepID=UPI00333BA39C
MGLKHPRISTSGNQLLSQAKTAKQDEFYTQLNDISNELRHYREQLRGKTILCNCDDPYESNFFKYFALNFNTLGLQKLIATSYAKSPIAGGYLPLLDIEGLKPEGREPYAIEINEVPDHNGDGATDLTDVEYLLRHDANTAKPLRGDSEYGAGDFRSYECVEYLRQADVVATNPPFSLFREYVAQLVKHDKKFIIIGNKNALTYKDTFKFVKENKIWTGVRSFSGGMWFVADYMGKYEKVVDGVKLINVPAIWLTNMDNPKRHEKIPLYKRYLPDEYPTYDNYDAIEVGKTAEIPVDYDGAMGVPITFLDKYNPEQFEILGITDRDNNSGVKTKEYTEADAQNPGDLNRRGVILVNGEYKSTYARLIIRRKV